MASAVGDWAQPANTVVADNAQCRARCAGSTNLTHSLHQLKSSNNYFCANVVRCNSAQLLSVVAIISIQTQTVRQVWLLRRRWSCCPASASVAKSQTDSGTADCQCLYQWACCQSPVAASRPTKGVPQFAPCCASQRRTRRVGWSG